jgi:hypothetical protein
MNLIKFRLEVWHKHVIMQILYMHESLRNMNSGDKPNVIFKNDFGSILSWDIPQILQESRTGKMEVLIGGRRTGSDDDIMVYVTNQAGFVKENILQLFSDWKRSRPDVVVDAKHPEYEF